MQKYCSDMMKRTKCSLLTNGVSDNEVAIKCCNSGRNDMCLISLLRMKTDVVQLRNMIIYNL